MTDYTKLIERLRHDTARHDDESRRLCNQAADAIDALLADMRRLTREKQIEKENAREWWEQADALQAKLDELQRQEPVAKFITSQESLTPEMQQVLNSMPYTSTEAPKALEPEPLIKFRHGCKWCGKAKCAAGCYGITKGTP